MQKNETKKIVFTGGGSGGHLFPAVALIDAIIEKRFDVTIEYIGSTNGIESKIIKDKDIAYHSIQTGKLRRYLSFQNLLDIFRLIIGICQSLIILIKIKKSCNRCLLFSTGGFVSIPPAIAAKILGIPQYMHEQTSRLGLANKINSMFAAKIYTSFGSTAKMLPNKNVTLSGNPVRKELFAPLPEKLMIDNIDVIQRSKPLLFITGGGNGSELINHAVFNSIEQLSQRYLIIHQVGEKHLTEAIKYKSNSYLPLAFATEIITLFKTADIILSRAGAGTVSELLAIKKRSIFVPLKIAQQNEQYHNAMEAHEKLGSTVIQEDSFSTTPLPSIIESFSLKQSETNLERDKKLENQNTPIEILTTAIRNYFDNV